MNFTVSKLFQRTGVTMNKPLHMLKDSSKQGFENVLKREEKFERYHHIAEGWDVTTFCSEVENLKKSNSLIFFSSSLSMRILPFRLYFFCL